MGGANVLGHKVAKQIIRLQRVHAVLKNRMKEFFTSLIIEVHFSLKK